MRHSFLSLDFYLCYFSFTCSILFSRKFCVLLYPPALWSRVITVFMSLLFLICKAVHSHCLNCYASCSWMQNESWVFLSSSWSSVLLIVQIFLFCPTNPNVVAWMQCRWRNLCFIDICTLCRGRTCVWHYTIKYRALVVPGNKELGSTHSFRWSQLEELSGDKALTGPFIYTANQHTHTNTHPYV